MVVAVGVRCAHALRFTAGRPHLSRLRASTARYVLTLLKTTLLTVVLAAVFVATGGSTGCAVEQGEPRAEHRRTARFPAASDTHSRSDAPTRNFGRASRLVAKRGTSIRRAYLRFNVLLPTDRVVTRATPLSAKLD